MSLPFWSKKILLLHVLLLICCTCFANENLFREARALQRDGKFDEAIVAFKKYLSQPVAEGTLTDEQHTMHIEALVQLMNTYQSKGEPNACISALQEVFNASPVIQKECLRDYYSVMGYALSRTERMKEAEETMFRALALPLRRATHERYFRDYAYAAAVFYSNPKYQKEVISWCQEAMLQAEMCKNTSGKQWVTAMLGALYKQNGHLNKALLLFQQSKEEAELRNDELGVLNSLHALVDLFLYWNTPEYANIYASEAIRLEKDMVKKNPMVSAQTYINKGRVLHQLGETDSVFYYTEHARGLCQSLPYNSGLVDVDLLYGTCLTDRGGDSLLSGVQELERVVRHGTAINKAKAYHQLAQTYLKCENSVMAEAMLDSMYSLLDKNGSTIYIRLDYKPILNHYLASGNSEKIEQYTRLMLQEQQALKEKKLNFNIVESFVDLQIEQKAQELKIVQLREANQRLWFMACMTISVLVIFVIVVVLIKQKKKHVKQMKQADEKFTLLIQKLNQSNNEKEMRVQEIKEFLQHNEKRQQLETFTPSILQTNGESKFRQCFELLHPHFLPRLREKVSSVTSREELLSMLIALKQDNKRIAELLAIAPRSVLMLRHRFRQKIGMTTELSLEDFIEDILEQNDRSGEE